MLLSYLTYSLLLSTGIARTGESKFTTRSYSFADEG